MSEIRFDTAIKFADAPADASPSAKPAKGKASLSFGRGKPKIKRKELLEISQQLFVMLDTGVSIADALESVVDNADKPHVQQVLGSVCESVKAGDPLSVALARHPGSFPKIYRSLIVASEKGGMMAQMLERATDYIRDELEIVRKVRGALTYPLVMFGFAVTTTIFLLSFVLPRFVVIYRGKEDRLPTPTKVLIAISDVMTTQWHLLIPAVAGAGVMTFLFLRSPAGRTWWHTTQMKLPLLGTMFKSLHLSRGLRLIGTLAAAGVTLNECVDTARELASNEHYTKLWDSVGRRIGMGDPFSKPLEESKLVPSSTVQMIKSGEASGRLAQVTERVAEHAERDLKTKISEATRFIEPAMIILMGGLIGGVTMALLLPVFTVSRVMAQ